jgi:DNA invertase Pin-like site-specific DNA recombinase
MPQANKTMIQIYAAMSEWERDQISARTKAALAAAKKRGVRLGVKGRHNLASTIEAGRNRADAFAEKLREQIGAYKQLGYSQRRIVEGLNRLNVRTPRGGTWSLKQVQLLLARLERAGRTPMFTV